MSIFWFCCLYNIRAGGRGEQFSRTMGKEQGGARLSGDKSIPKTVCVKANHRGILLECRARRGFRGPTTPDSEVASLLVFSVSVKSAGALDEAGMG
jgi:hypothetical protein